MDSDPFSANATSQLSSVFKDAVSNEHSLQMTSQHERSHSEWLCHPCMLQQITTTLTVCNYSANLPIVYRTGGQWHGRCRPSPDVYCQEAEEH